MTLNCDDLYNKTKKSRLEKLQDKWCKDIRSARYNFDKRGCKIIIQMINVVNGLSPEETSELSLLGRLSKKLDMSKVALHSTI